VIKRTVRVAVTGGVRAGVTTGGIALGVRMVTVPGMVTGGGVTTVVIVTGLGVRMVTVPGMATGGGAMTVVIVTGLGVMTATVPGMATGGGVTTVVIVTGLGTVTGRGAGQPRPLRNVSAQRIRPAARPTTCSEQWTKGRTPTSLCLLC
jgi:hypothetical protein